MESRDRRSRSAVEGHKGRSSLYESPLLPRKIGGIGGGAPYTNLRFFPRRVGVIGGETPYTEIGWRAGLEKFRLRARYFLRAEKVPKDALRGARARWVPRLRCAAAVTHRPRPLRDLPHFTGDSTRALALAVGAQDLAAMPLSRRPLRPELADENPPALALRRLSAGADGVGGFGELGMRS